MSDITRAGLKQRRADLCSRERDLKHSIKLAAPSGGARRDRTDDLLLAKQALSQLSYGPSPVSYASRHLGRRAEPQLARGNRPPSSFGLRRGSLRLASASEGLVGLGRFELPTSRLSSARSNQLSYKPEPGVSGQKPAIRGRFVASDYRILITDSWSARSRRKRNGDGGVLQIG